MKRLIFVCGMLFSTSVCAETKDFGGHTEKFKGAGDKIPPRCQISVPKTATEPFFVSWYCSDDNAPDEKIKTELWIFRKDAPSSDLVKTFLGFPASIRVDEGLLRSENLAAGLPVGFKLVATDQAGITTVSPLLTVLASTTAAEVCSLEIQAAATSSTETVTGTPSSTVVLSNAAVRYQQTNQQSYSIATIQAVEAQPCEIDSICAEEDAVRFLSNLTIDETALASEGTLSGEITVTPGGLVVQGQGTYKSLDGNLTEVSLSGSEQYESKETTVKLICGTK